MRSTQWLLLLLLLKVLEQFHGNEMEETAPDIVEKTRYALWRAAEIRKALREGRQPAPPPDAGMPAAAGTGSSAAAGDLFAGPAYERSMPDQAEQPPPGALKGSMQQTGQQLPIGGRDSANMTHMQPHKPLQTI